METTRGGLHRLADTSKQFARRLAIIGENRLELLAVEVQEGRERLLYAVLMALGAAVFGLLAGLTLTAAIVVLLWPYSALGALLTLTVVYGGAGFYLYRRVMELLRNWQTLPASLEQLRKDRECLEKMLA